MRIAIDLQACQSAERAPGYARSALGLARAVRSAAPDKHEIMFVANGAFPETLEPLAAALAPGCKAGPPLHVYSIPEPVAARQALNRWRRRAAGQVREAFLMAMRADAVLVLDAAGGWDDDAVVTATGLPCVAVLPVALPEAREPYEYLQWRQDVADVLRGAARVFAVGEAARCSARDLVGRDTAKVHTLPGAMEDAGAALLRSLEEAAAAGSFAKPATAARRLRLAYVSPLPPAASGIADYSAELLPALAEHYDIELIVSQSEPVAASLAEAFAIRSPDWFEVNADRYDRVLYHLGNSPFHGHMVAMLRRHPGTVVLHDFYLGHLFGYAQHSGLAPQALRRAVFRSHGMAALSCLRERGEAATLARYPCNFDVFLQADGVIVHSAHAIELARTWYGDCLPCPVHRLPLAHAAPSVAPDRTAARARLGIDDDAFIVCSFGYVGSGKLSRDLVEAWLASPYAGDAHCQLVLVGGHQMDGEYRRALEARLEHVGAAAGIRITGYVEPGVYRAWLAAADLAVQLRTSSRGETSRAILDAMAHGVPVVVNAHGAAAELPAGIVERLADNCTVADITAALVRCHDAGRRADLAARGARHVRAEHDPRVVARQYRDAIEASATMMPASAAGIARLAIRKLAGEATPGNEPERCDLHRLARVLGSNHPQAGGRPWLPDTELLDAQRRTMMVSSAPLRGLMLVGAERLACDGAAMRVRAIQAAYRVAGQVVDAAHVYVHAETSSGPWHWAEWPLAGTVCSARVDVFGKAAAHGLALVESAPEDDPALVSALVARIRRQRYDFIQLEQPYLWKLLQAVLQHVPADERPALLVYSSSGPALCDGAKAAGADEDDFVVDACRRAEVEAARAASLVITPTRADQARLAVLRGNAQGIHVFPNGGGPHDASERDMLAVYRDYLPQRPFALVIGDDDPAAGSGFSRMFGESLAFLPPDAMLVAAGGLAAYLERDPAFARWAGINRARCQLLASADALALASLRRYAHVVVLPHVRADRAGGSRAQAAQALVDGCHVLATSAALCGLGGADALSRVCVENDAARFRTRLAELLERPRPAPVAIAPGVSWHVTLSGLAAKVRRALDAARISSRRDQRAGVA